MRARTSLSTIALLLFAATASAAPIALSSTFNADFSASQSLWAGGPNAGLDESGRTGGSVGLYYSVKANTGTVAATQNAALMANYLSETAEGSLTTIALDFIGDPNGGTVEAAFGAAASTGMFLDISGCVGVVVLGSCVGVPYNIDADIPVIDEGFFLDPSTTHTPVIDTQRTANAAAQTFGVGSLDVVIGNLGPSMNLDLDQNIYFTPTSISGTASYRNVTSGAAGSSLFVIPTDAPRNLQLALGVGTWEISFLDIMLQNTFRNDINLELRPAFDYIVGSWPPPGGGLFSFDLIDQTFALGFNQIQNLGTIRVDVVAAQQVPEPTVLVLFGFGLAGVAVRRLRLRGR